MTTLSTRTTLTVRPPNTVVRFPPPTYLDVAFLSVEYNELLAALLASLTAY